MTLPAIEFDHVSKRYVIRHEHTRYLKDRMTGALQRLNPLANKREKSEGHTVEDFWALKDVSFSIQPGESVGIVGPNGSGKSTTLKILAGVTQQTSGRAAVNGKLGALIEVGAGFHPELSGRENVYLNGSILGMKKAEIRKKFDAIVAFAEVEKFIDTPVKHYSSGMYVRLGFAIAVHNEPEILLVDEVLAVGDLSFQRKCFDKMQELKASGRTFILISHSMPQIESLCERAIMLRNGRLVADGLTAEVAKKYVEESDPHSGKSEISGGDAPVKITNIQLVDKNGEPTTQVQVGQPMTFVIDYQASQPIADCIFSMHLERDQLNVYDSDTLRLGVTFGTLSGSGQVRCEVPDLSLMPNSYGVRATIYNAAVQALSVVRYPHMFTIFGPPSLSTLGCGIAEEGLQRGIVYGRARWYPVQDSTREQESIKQSSS